MDALEQDIDNLRGAFEWALRNHEVEWALRLFASTELFFEYRSRRAEGVDWAVKAVRGASDHRSPLTVRALGAASWLTLSHDTELAREYAEQAMDLALRIDDEPGYHRAQVRLGYALAHHHFEMSERHLREAADYFAGRGDRWGRPLP